MKQVSQSQQRNRSVFQVYDGEGASRTLHRGAQVEGEGSVVHCSEMIQNPVVGILKIMQLFVTRVQTLIEEQKSGSLLYLVKLGMIRNKI